MGRKLLSVAVIVSIAAISYAILTMPALASS